MKLQTKKGLGYVMVLTPFILVIYIYATFTLFSYDEIPQDLNFGDYLLETSSLVSEIPSEELFSEELSTSIIDEYKENFLKSSNSQNCFENGDVFFLDESKNNSLCLPTLPNSSSELTSEFGLNLLSKLSQIENLISKDNLDFETNFENSELIFTSNFKSTSSLIDLNLEKSISTNLALDKEFNLIETLNQNIPQLSSEISLQTPLCRQDTSKSKEDCIIEISNNTLMKNIYDYSSEIKYIEEKEYFTLSISLFDNNLNLETLSFNLRLENNIPFDHVDFSLNTYPKQDNLIEVNIKKPIEPDKNLHGFIVLYSYENFFDSTFSGYDNLINVLSEKERVPNEFVDIIYPFASNKNLEIRRSDQSLGFDLTMMFIPNLNPALENSSALLTQIYNFDTNNYDVLESGKTLYAYVFAVDKTYKYYIDETHFKNNIKSIEVSEVTAPKSLTSSHFTQDSISDLQKGIAFNIEGYSDSKFDHYTIHLCSESGFTSLSSCVDLGSTSKNLNQNIIIFDPTKDNSALSSYSSYTLLSSQIELEYSTYFLYIIPRNSQGLGFEKTTYLSYEVISRTNRVPNYYIFDSSDIQSLRQTPFERSFSP